MKTNERMKTKFLGIVSLLSIVAIATLSSCEDKSTTTYRYNITNGVIGDVNAVVTSQYVLDLLTQRELNVTAAESSEGRQQADEQAMQMFNEQLELIDEADVLSRLNQGDTVSLQLNIYSPVNAVLAVEKWGKAALDRNKLKIEPVSKENLHIGETFRLTVKYDGQEIPMSEITWKFWPNEKQTVFSVDENGLVTATGIGRAGIQPVYQGCTAAREGGLCDITVVEAE